MAPHRPHLRPAPGTGPEPRTWPVDARAARSWPPIEGPDPNRAQIETGPDQSGPRGGPQADVNTGPQIETNPHQGAPDQGGSGGQASEGIA